MRISQASLFSLLFIPVLLSAVACAPPEGAPPVATPAFDAVAVRSEIEANLLKVSQAVADADAAAVAAWYTDEATLLPPDAEIVQGKQAIEDFWSARLGSGFTIEFTTRQVEGAGSLAYETGRYTSTRPSEGQEPVQTSGKYVVVWQKGSDETWRAHVDIWTSGEPPAQ